MMTENMRELKLPEHLCRAVEMRYGSRFGSAQEFLVHVLREVVRDDAAQMDDAERQLLQERLRDLGYL
jgi:hypothetical protein